MSLATSICRFSFRLPITLACLAGALAAAGQTPAPPFSPAAQMRFAPQTDLRREQRAKPASRSDRGI